MIRNLLLIATCLLVSGCSAIIKREPYEPMPSNLKELITGDHLTYSLETSFNKNHNPSCTNHENAVRDEIAKAAQEMGLVRTSPELADYIFHAHFDRCGGLDPDKNKLLLIGAALSGASLGIIPIAGPSETNLDLTITQRNKVVFKNRTSAHHYHMIGIWIIPLMISQRNEKPEILEVHNAVARQFNELEAQGGL